MMQLRMYGVGLILIVSACAQKPKPEMADKLVLPPAELYTHQTRRSLAQVRGLVIPFGGYSGLRFLKFDPQTGVYSFIAHTDRGPNAESINLKTRDKRPFLLPKFQPRWMFIQTDPKTKTFKVTKEVLLTDPQDFALSGLPQSSSEKEGHDEPAINISGLDLADHPMGIDPEGLCIDEKGAYWMADEYRPSILKFDAQGRLRKRYIPAKSLPSAKVEQINKKYKIKLMVEALSEDYRYRKNNRGFEAITCYQSKVYVLLQSPLPIKDEDKNRIVRMVEFDPATEKVTAEYEYILGPDVDRIGDMDVNPLTGEFYVLEQNGKKGYDGLQRLTRFSLPKEGRRITHFPFVDISDHGYDFAEKVEGLAYIDGKHWAVINDNDFGVSGRIDVEKKTVPMDPSRKTVLGIIQSEQ